MGRPFRRIYDQVADRWTAWRLVRWCERLSRVDRFEFDALVSQMNARRTLDESTTSEAHRLGEVMRQQDEQLQIAVAGLRPEEKILLHLLIKGTSYHAISVRLQMSDERVRQQLKSILCRLTN